MRKTRNPFVGIVHDLRRLRMELPDLLRHRDPAFIRTYLDNTLDRVKHHLEYLERSGGQ